MHNFYGVFHQFKERVDRVIRVNMKNDPISKFNSLLVVITLVHGYMKKTESIIVNSYFCLHVLFNNWL